MAKMTEGRRDLVTLIVALVLSLLLLWVSGKTRLASPLDAGMTVVSFFQGIASGLGNFFGNTIQSIQKLSELQKEYDLLLERFQELEYTQSDLTLLSEENRQLRSALAFSSSLQVVNAPAQIIAKNAGVYFGSLTLNKGSFHGIERGMPVVAVQDGKQGLIGKVQEVSHTTCLVEPIFSPGLFVGVRLADSRFDGLLHGQGSSSEPLILQYVDMEAQGKVQIGESVITSGLYSRYPAGIPIGTINAIQSRSYDNSLEFEVDPIISFARLEYVFIITEKTIEELLE